MAHISHCAMFAYLPLILLLVLSWEVWFHSDAIANEASRLRLAYGSSVKHKRTVKTHQSWKKLYVFFGCPNGPIHSIGHRVTAQKTKFVCSNKKLSLLVLRIVVLFYYYLALPSLFIAKAVVMARKSF